MSAIARFFEFEQRRTTLGREVRGGATTFLTMAYILLVNPQVLAAAGVPVTAAATATALAAGVMCILMGVVANFPMALASGMGLNALVAFTLTEQMGSWQAAMGLVVLNGLLILALVLLGVREAILHAIPRDLRLAIAAGIGLFIAFIGLKNGGLVTDHPATLVTYGTLRSHDVQVAMIGLVVTASLMIWRVTGALLIGILVATTVAVARGMTALPSEFPWPDFSTVFRADVRAAMQWQFVPLLLSIMMVDFFDTLGTVTAVSDQAKHTDPGGRIPRLRSILAIDSIAAAVGGAAGASSVTSYIESASGVAEGARTGLHTVVVGLLFLLAMFLAPLAAVVPASATAPALILVGFLMMTAATDIDFTRLENAIPAFLTLLTIPFTFSIAHGIGYGFLAYVLLHLARGRFRDIHPLLYAVAAAFLLYFVTE